MNVEFPGVCIHSQEGVFKFSFLEDGLLDVLKGRYRENYLTVAYLAGSWTSLLGDSPIVDIKPNRVIKKHLHAILSDPYDLMSRYALLYDQLVSQIRTDIYGVVHIPYIKGFEKTPIYKEYQFFRRTGNPAVFRFLLTFLSFGKKCFFLNEAFYTTAFRKWEEVEERLGGLILPEWTDDLAEIVQFFMSTFSSDVFLPRHGPGAVSEVGVRGSHSKNQIMAPAERLQLLYGDRDLFEDRGDHSSEHSEHARLMFVPKNFKTSRTICMEPAVFQWAQQGVRMCLEEAISSGPLRHFVRLQDQGFNRTSALFGSITNWVDTIDLSSASDSVSLSLVGRIFPIGILAHLLASRSHGVLLPDGSIRYVKKFAPMGSAVCFPIQTIIYSAVCLYAYYLYVRDVEMRDVSIRDVFHRLSTGRLVLDDKGPTLYPFRCYGDDITCDSRVTSLIVGLLSALGFSVNTEKSFTGEQSFRESCGGHYLYGHDVTPLIFKTWEPIGEKNSIETMATLVDLANRARDYGYDSLRQFVLVSVDYLNIAGLTRPRYIAKKCRKNPILRSNDPESSFAILVDDTPDNSHLIRESYPDCRSKICKDLQSDGVWSISPVSVAVINHDESDDWYDYISWCRSSFHRKSDSDIIASDRKDSLRVGVGWRFTPSN